MAESALGLILTFNTNKIRPVNIIMSKCHPNPRDLDIILPSGLQNCPRAYGPWAVLEALGQDFIQNPSGWGGIFYQNAMGSEIFPGVPCTTHGILNLITWLVNMMPMAF